MRPLMQLGASCMLGQLMPYIWIPFGMMEADTMWVIHFRPTACDKRTYGGNSALLDPLYSTC